LDELDKPDYEEVINATGEKVYRAQGKILKTKQFIDALTTLYQHKGTLNDATGTGQLERTARNFNADTRAVGYDASYRAKSTGNTTTSK
jgi:hypothetical protein